MIARLRDEIQEALQAVAEELERNEEELTYEALSRELAFYLSTLLGRELESYDLTPKGGPDSQIAILAELCLNSDATVAFYVFLSYRNHIAIEAILPEASNIVGEPVPP